MNETNQYVHRFCFFIDLESDEKEASNISPDELTTAYAMRVNEIEESPSIPDELFHQSTYDKKAGVFSPKTKFFGKGNN